MRNNSKSPNNNIAVRPASPDDADVIARISCRAWQAQSAVPQSAIAGFSQEQRVNSFCNAIIKGQEYFFLAAIDRKNAGFVSCSYCRDVDSCSAWGEIINLYVDPDFQRRGIGSALLEHAASHLRRQGCHHIILWTAREDRNAIAFYRKHDFSADGSEKKIDVNGFQLPVCRYRRSL